MYWPIDYTSKLSFIRVFELTKITYLCWSIKCIPILHLSRCSNKQKLPTSFGELNACQKLKLFTKCKL